MLYLQKANNDLVNHCHCGAGYVSAPAQMDCPWCGCGWLFTCTDCRKAFTFAVAKEVDVTLEDMARRNLSHWNRPGEQIDEQEVQSWMEFMQGFLEGLVAGQQYVYFDGVIVPVNSAGLKVEGWHSVHDLSVVPQVEALLDPSIIDGLLGNPRYWKETARPDN